MLFCASMLVVCTVVCAIMVHVMVNTEASDLEKAECWAERSHKFWKLLCWFEDDDLFELVA